MVGTGDEASVTLVDEKATATLDDDVAAIETNKDDGDDISAVMNLYSVNLFGPPQIWVVLPLQGILHCAFPSDAGPPPLSRELPQSMKISFYSPENAVENEGQNSQHSPLYSVPE